MQQSEQRIEENMQMHCGVWTVNLFDMELRI